MDATEAAELLGRLNSQTGANRASLFSGPGGERETLQRRTYETLRMALMGGVFALGQEVTLRSLAAALGTSAMPVREAIGRLITERALVMLPNRTVIVPRMTRGRCIELFQARQALERLAAEAACARATSELIDRIADVDTDLRAKACRARSSRRTHGQSSFPFRAVPRQSERSHNAVDRDPLAAGRSLHGLFLDNPWRALDGATSSDDPCLSPLRQRGCNRRRHRARHRRNAWPTSAQSGFQRCSKAGAPQRRATQAGPHALNSASTHSVSAQSARSRAPQSLLGGFPLHAHSGQVL